jgi:hypothetical protein
MHNDAAGIATVMPTMSLVAATTICEQAFKGGNKAERTDITPQRRDVFDAVRPYHKVDEANKTGEGGPYHEKTCP